MVPLLSETALFSKGTSKVESKVLTEFSTEPSFKHTNAIRYRDEHVHILNFDGIPICYSACNCASEVVARGVTTLEPDADAAFYATRGGVSVEETESESHDPCPTGTENTTVS